MSWRAEVEFRARRLSWRWLKLGKWDRGNILDEWDLKGRANSDEGNLLLENEGNLVLAWLNGEENDLGLGLNSSDKNILEHGITRNHKDAMELVWTNKDEDDLELDWNRDEENDLALDGTRCMVDQETLHHPSNNSIETQLLVHTSVTGVWVGLNFIPMNSTNMSSMTDADAGSCTWTDSTTFHFWLKL